MAGAIVDSADRILIAQRPTGRHLADGWEFPGGKLEPGEARAAGLARELLEEIGIEVQHCRPLIKLRHSYPDRNVLLDVWFVDRFAGTPRTLDHQALRWCTRDELPYADLLAADRAVIAALRLPTMIVSPSGDNYRVVSYQERGSLVTLRKSDLNRYLCGVSCHTSSQVVAAERAGADFIVLNAPLAAADLASVCDLANLPIFAVGVDLDTAWLCGAVGISRCAA